MGSGSLADESSIRAFVAPNNGVVHVLQSPEGLTLHITGIESSGSTLLLEERTCCFDMKGEDAPQEVVYRFSLRAEGDRLIRVEKDSETVLIDLGNKPWSVPAQSYGPKANEATPLAMCSIVSRETKELFGQERDVIMVRCVAKSESLPDRVVENVFASGLGFVIKDGYKLVHVENP